MTTDALKLAVIGAGFGFGVVLGVVIWRSCRNSSAKWSDLIIDDATGQTSITKVWTHLVNATVLGILVRVCWNAVPSDGVAWLFFVVLGLIGGSQSAIRALGTKFGGAPTAPTPGVVTTSKTEITEKTVAVPAAPAPAPDSAAQPPTGRSTP